MQETPVPNLTDRLAEALRLVDAAIEDAAQRLESQPDNPAIQRVSDKVSAFVLPLSEMTAMSCRGGANPATRRERLSWAPFDHDWLAQYRYARELLELRRFSALRELLAGAGYRDPSHGYRSFAPEVIENIKRITGDLRAAVEMTDSRRMHEGLPSSGQEGRDAAAPRLLSGRPQRRNRM